MILYSRVRESSSLPVRFLKGTQRDNTRGVPFFFGGGREVDGVDGVDGVERVVGPEGVMC